MGKRNESLPVTRSVVGSVPLVSAPAPFGSDTAVSETPLDESVLDVACAVPTHSARTHKTMLERRALGERNADMRDPGLRVRSQSAPPVGARERRK
jgi:hypothetical protein